MTEKHFILFYEYAPDYLERRGPLRPAHLKAAEEAVSRGELQLGGALADPPDGGVLIFKARSREIVENFAKSDPYVLNGVVTSWRVREWTTVVGPGALTKI
ncbi:MAG: hypothetical protein GC153_12065 [Alphaproteobacteria bacterium]|nr:hypothetical protein [Alphaproteobacteria bacterium]